ncbi:MAG: ammonium transporter, partial [Mycobacterium sp.]
EQLWRQAVGAGAVLLYSAIGTAIVAVIVKYTIGLRISDEGEAAGADESQHAEGAYDFVALGSGSVIGRHSSGREE